MLGGDATEVTTQAVQVSYRTLSGCSYTVPTHCTNG
jgi:hypothetical protein